LREEGAEGVVMYEVVDFLRDPPGAVREAARMLAPGGRLLIVDFAPHELEFLREQFAHERLGLAEAQIAQWLSEAGLALLQRRNLGPGGGTGKGKVTGARWLPGGGRGKGARG